jgi:hypothetical protein
MNRGLALITPLLIVFASGFFIGMGIVLIAMEA